MEQTPTYDSSEGSALGTWSGRSRAWVRRLRQATSVLAGFGFSYVLHQLGLGPRPREAGVAAAASRLEMPGKLREALEELGPTAIKLGQVLSSRADLVPEAYVRELRKLQDDVPASPLEEVRQVVRDELGAEIEALFSEFEPVPRASASIAQVHFARLPDGTPVGVKVQHVGVAEAIETDLDIILWAARQAERAISWAAQNHLHEIAQEFAFTLRQELNFRIEGHNTDRLRANMAREEAVRVPEIHWDFTTRRVLVVEWVEGAKVGEPEQLAAFGVEAPAAAKNLAGLLIRQVMRDGYFHGDPHAGNVLFTGGAEVAFLDCGNCVAVDRSVRENLIALLLAALNDDPQELTEYLLLLGATGDRTDIQQLTNDIGRMLSYYSSFQSSAQVGLGNLLDQLLEMVLRHGVRMQPSLAAIAKSMVVVEGICLDLDREFNSQAVVREVSHALLLERLAPGRLLDDLLRILRSTNRHLGLMPRQVSQLLQRMTGSGLRLHMAHENLDRSLHRLDLMVNRLTFALVVSAVIMSSTSLVTSSQGAGPLGRGMTVVYLVIGLVLGGWLLFSILRSGRL